MDNTITFEGMETFGMPAVICDKHLQAPEVELRLIIFLLRNVNRSFLKDQLIQVLKADEKRLEEAFTYWIAAGILFKTAGKYTFERPKVAANDIMHYSADQIATRIDNDNKIKFLYTKTEELLAKPLTTDDASAILSLVDWVGLPAEVVAMLIQYCTENGKSLRKIVSTGIEWAEKEINTYEKADLHINNERAKKETVNKISRLLGVNNRAITEGEQKLFMVWSEEYKFNTDIIKLAYENTVKSTGKYSYQYMDKILNSWYLKQYKTLAEINENEKSDVGVKKPGKKARYESTADLDAQKSMDLSWDIIEDSLKNE